MGEGLGRSRDPPAASGRQEDREKKAEVALPIPIPAAATARLHHCQRETGRDTGEEAKKVMLHKVGSRIR